MRNRKSKTKNKNTGSEYILNSYPLLYDKLKSLNDQLYHVHHVIEQYERKVSNRTLRREEVPKGEATKVYYLMLEERIAVFYERYIVPGFNNSDYFEGALQCHCWYRFFPFEFNLEARDWDSLINIKVGYLGTERLSAFTREKQNYLAYIKECILLSIAFFEIAGEAKQPIAAQTLAKERYRRYLNAFNALKGESSNLLLRIIAFKFNVSLGCKFYSAQDEFVSTTCDSEVLDLLINHFNAYSASIAYAYNYKNYRPYEELLTFLLDKPEPCDSYARIYLLLSAGDRRSAWQTLLPLMRAHLAQSVLTWSAVDVVTGGQNLSEKGYLWYFWFLIQSLTKYFAWFLLVNFSVSWLLDKLTKDYYEELELVGEEKKVLEWYQQGKWLFEANLYSDELHCSIRSLFFDVIAKLNKADLTEEEIKEVRVFLKFWDLVKSDSRPFGKVYSLFFSYEETLAIYEEHYKSLEGLWATIYCMVLRFEIARNAIQLAQEKQDLPVQLKWAKKFLELSPDPYQVTPLLPEGYEVGYDSLLGKYVIREVLEITSEAGAEFKEDRLIEHEITTVDDMKGISSSCDMQPIIEPKVSTIFSADIETKQETYGTVVAKKSKDKLSSPSVNEQTYYQEEGEKLLKQEEENFGKLQRELRWVAPGGRLIACYNRTQGDVRPIYNREARLLGFAIVDIREENYYQHFQKKLQEHPYIKITGSGGIEHIKQGNNNIYMLRTLNKQFGGARVLADIYYNEQGDMLLYFNHLIKKHDKGHSINGFIPYVYDARIAVPPVLAVAKSERQNRVIHYHR